MFLARDFIDEDCCLRCSRCKVDALFYEPPQDPMLFLDFVVHLDRQRSRVSQPLRVEIALRALESIVRTRDFSTLSQTRFNPPSKALIQPGDKNEDTALQKFS